MKLNFCTLFNSAYLSRGVTLYQSLEDCGADFHLYVFAFDDAAADFLRQQPYSRMTVITLAEFEDSELLRIKPSRTAGEYCWTCTPSTILYCIEKFTLEHCTYIDADMYFYRDPSVLIEEMGGKDVLLTDHFYSPAYDQSKESGRFCVQFMFFRNSVNGMKALRWWRAACVDWCYNRVEDGKFGDQKYLDDWETRFEGVHVLEHRGGGLAPWNIQLYEVFYKGKELHVRQRSTGKEFPVVFFHYHGLKFFSGEIVQITTPVYRILQAEKFALFFPYLKKLVSVSAAIRQKNITFDPDGANGKAPFAPWGIRLLLFYYLADVKASFANCTGRNLAERRAHHPYYFTSNFNA
jgi:hypothetical protein